ncbi:hypothetical protein H4S01_005764, partial [Coemansia sp. RSA 2610]
RSSARTCTIRGSARTEYTTVRQAGISATKFFAREAAAAPQLAWSASSAANPTAPLSLPAIPTN